jgi:putative thiamine transport system ATP-binding protein
MSIFKAENICIYQNQRPLLKGLSFSVSSGQVVTLMGPSGSGKSSILNYIAGALPAGLVGSGALFLDDLQIDQLKIIDRKVGILFQDDLLFPHLTVGQNLLFGLRQNASKADRLKNIQDTLTKAQLGEYNERMPSSLSGGQRARVSLLRTLLSKPKLILLDEPFSKLDKLLRSSFRDFVFSEIRAQNIPCLLVTHDADDIPPDAQTITISN